MQWTVPACLRVLAFAALLVVTMAASGARDSAARATPEPAGVDVPAPQDCTVEPREFPFFAESAVQSEPATPAPLEAAPAEQFTIPAGDAPDEETAAAVTATVRESLACRNANELLRAYALFTDDMLGSLFGGPSTVDPDIRALIADEAIKAVPPRQRIALIGIDDIVALPDGRVGAVVETVNASQRFRDYIILAEDASSGRWLIDETRVMG